MLLWLAAVALGQVPAHVDAARDRIDWTAAGAEAVGVLAGFLATDTTNPPGNEEAGAVYLAGVLSSAGIASEIVSHGGGRASLIARVEGEGTEPPLCLLSHLDVVPAERDLWTVEPLSGVVRDGYLYGRGALDMKGMGALETLVLVWLARAEVPLRRDVVLLAVADEEGHGLGMRTLVDERWGDIGCSHLINEGGVGIRDAFFEGQHLHPISVAEKGYLWVDVVASGAAGHGSVVQADEAPGRLLSAMRAIEKRRAKTRFTDETWALLHAVGVHKGGATGAVLRSKGLSKLFVKPRLLKEPASRSVITDTVHLTGMAGAVSPNVVPSQVRATYDCRLLPGTTDAEVLADLTHRIRKIDGVSLEVTQYAPSSGSEWRGDPLFDAIARYAVEGRPDAVAAPFLSVGFTDSLYARRLGVRAFGYVPFEVTPEEASTMHGHDERVPVDQIGDGLRRLFSMVVDFAGA